jgi:hypothetical protein
MKRTLLIERKIEAGKKLCKPCQKGTGKGDEFCELFWEYCLGCRLPACLEAERRAKEVSHG